MTDEEKISQIVQSFRKMHQAFYKQMWHNADQLGVTVLQLHILRILAHESKMGLNELAHKVNANKSTVSETVERMVQAGLVDRSRSTEDRRAVCLTLTPKGLETKKQSYQAYLERLGKVAIFSDEEAETLLTLHDRLYEQIKILGDET